MRWLTSGRGVSTKHRWPPAVSVVFALMVILLASCGGSSFVYQEPAGTGDGWSTAELSEVGLDVGLFIDLVDQAAADEDRAVDGILVVKDGKQVLEKYFDGYRFDYDDPQFRGEPVEFDESTRHNLMSITKAVTGSLVVLRSTRVSSLGSTNRWLATSANTTVSTKVRRPKSKSNTSSP